MEKRQWLAVGIVLAALVVAALVFLRPRDARFQGDRIVSADPARFYLRFDVMNTEDAESLALMKGDSLHVHWQIDSGSADIRIGMAGETPLYQANSRGNGDAADFELPISQSGVYTVSVSGREAKGWMEFAQEKSAQ